MGRYPIGSDKHRQQEKTSPKSTAGAFSPPDPSHLGMFRSLDAADQKLLTEIYSSPRSVGQWSPRSAGTPVGAAADGAADAKVVELQGKLAVAMQTVARFEALQSRLKASEQELAIQQVEHATAMLLKDQQLETAREESSARERQLASKHAEHEAAIQLANNQFEAASHRESAGSRQIAELEQQLSLLKVSNGGNGKPVDGIREEHLVVSQSTSAEPSAFRCKLLDSWDNDVPRVTSPAIVVVSKLVLIWFDTGERNGSSTEAFECCIFCEMNRRTLSPTPHNSEPTHPC